MDPIHTLTVHEVARLLMVVDATPDILSTYRSDSETANAIRKAKAFAASAKYGRVTLKVMSN